MHPVHGAFRMLRIEALSTRAAVLNTLGSFEVFKAPSHLLTDC